MSFPALPLAFLLHLSGFLVLPPPFPLRDSAFPCAPAVVDHRRRLSPRSRRALSTPLSPVPSPRGAVGDALGRAQGLRGGVLPQGTAVCTNRRGPCMFLSSTHFVVSQCALASSTPGGARQCAAVLGSPCDSAAAGSAIHVCRGLAGGRVLKLQGKTTVLEGRGGKRDRKERHCLRGEERRRDHKERQVSFVCLGVQSHKERQAPLHTCETPPQGQAEPLHTCVAGFAEPQAAPPLH